MYRTKVLLVDDHEIVRTGLRTILEKGGSFEVAGEAENGREAVKLVDKLKPDVVVMDISMPELNGLDAVRQIVKEAPGTEVLVLTMHDSEELIRETLEAGARGYLLKSDAARQLVPAVEALGRHKPYFTPKASQVVLDGFLLGDRRPKGGPSRNLTTREREILQLLGEGKSNKEVAAALHISVKTAETHRANIMRKIDAHSVSELVRYAVRNHIIEP
jgi:DNA-binding NarL/FixJ family response regulator